MRWQNIFVASLLAGNLAACGEPLGQAANLLDFRPTARQGGQFVLQVDGSSVDGGCRVADGITGFAVSLRAGDLDETLTYDIAAADLRDCEMRLLVPEGIRRELAVAAIRGDNSLARAGYATVTEVVAGEVSNLAMDLWPAIRHSEPGMAASNGPDLIAVDVLRQLGSFLFVLRFADVVSPAADERADSVAGNLYLQRSDGRLYRIALDAARTSGLLFEALDDDPRIFPDDEVPFSFRDNELRIRVPYAQVGGSEAQPTSSPELGLGIRIADVFSGRASDALPAALLTAAPEDVTLLPTR